jgi:hypothetical protein
VNPYVPAWVLWVLAFVVGLPLLAWLIIFAVAVWDDYRWRPFE